MERNARSNAEFVGSGAETTFAGLPTGFESSIPFLRDSDDYQMSRTGYKGGAITKQPGETGKVESPTLIEVISLSDKVQKFYTLDLKQAYIDKTIVPKYFSDAYTSEFPDNSADYLKFDYYYNNFFRVGIREDDILNNDQILSLPDKLEVTAIPLIADSSDVI